jgi:hypothetical protein
MKFLLVFQKAVCAFTKEILKVAGTHVNEFPKADGT